MVVNWAYSQEGRKQHQNGGDGLEPAMVAMTYAERQIALGEERVLKTDLKRTGAGL